MNVQEYKKHFAIVVIGYNNGESILRLLKSLQRAEYGKDTVDLIISIDHSGNQVVESIARNFEWHIGTKKIRAFKERQGLKKHILSCGNFLRQYDAIFVFEDDIIVSPCFYEYGKKCIDFYYNDNAVEGVSLYSSQWNQNANFPFVPLKTKYDMYFLQSAPSWGQIWFKDRFEKFMEWYNDNQDFFDVEDVRIPHNLYMWGDNSWLKYHIAYCIVQHKYFVYPYYSYTSTFTEVGTHYKTALTRFHADLLVDKEDEYRFANYDEERIRYDAFYENENLKTYLEKKYDDTVEVDLYGTKCFDNKQRYLLSTQVLPYKIINKYGLQLRPMELNIYFEIDGEEIFLYDTCEKVKLKRKYIKQQSVKKWNYFMKERFLMGNEIIPVCRQKISNLLRNLMRM